VVIKLSGYVEHGQTDGAGIALHDGRGGIVSAGLDGAAAPNDGRVGIALGFFQGSGIILALQPNKKKGR
jgi:hypothetical protein